MRFMVMVKSTAESEAGKLPTNEMMAAMAKFNAELEAAGMLVSAGGLKPTRTGARIQWSDRKPKVSDGPFTETKELVGGFWILEAKSREDLVAFMERAPFVDGTIEIRGFLGPEDFAAGESGKV